MSERCDICIEEQCGGKKDLHKCSCSDCVNINECNKLLSPTVRITTLCTQFVNHV
jgi:hypothetical protein